jgi:hypothetical protein
MSLSTGSKLPSVVARVALVLAACALSGTFGFADLRIPAFTAYLEPDPEGATVQAPEGISGWRGPLTRVLWFGELKSAGQIDCALVVHLPPNTSSTLRLTVAEQSHEVVAKGDDRGLVIVPFGSYTVAKAGYQRFALASGNEAGNANGDLEALMVGGTAAENAHFNMKPRRNAASVHLMYAVAKDLLIQAFYSEMTGLEDPPWTYYMACGWHRGYFGMQVNSPSERRIIFSVWDSGHEANDRTKVSNDDRVTLIAKGPGVVTGDFGNEGTGGHSHWVYSWKTGQPQRFLVTAKPTDLTHTAYSGYFFLPEKKQWRLISSWRAPKEGGYLHGLYSFSENFGGANGQLRREALYGNQWVRTRDGRWTELTKAWFSHDSTGKADRFDRFMGVKDGKFFLSQGGFVPGYTELGKVFERPFLGTPPVDLELPEQLGQ